MIAATDIKKGMAIELDGQLYTVIDVQHIKMGRGSPQIRIKLKDIQAGHTLERSFQATERFADVRLEISNAQYLYQDGDLHYFMAVKSFEQIALSTAQLGAAFKKYFREGMTLVILRHGDRAVGVEMPLNVELKATQTAPSLQGNHAQSG